MRKSHEIDFTSGPLLKRIILYALPIIGVNVLQLLFTTADIAVLGMFTSDQAVAGVGATAHIINIMVGFFFGLSVGTNVLLARAVGAHDKEKARKLVGTSVLISLIFGIVVMTVGILLSETLLVMTNCPDTVLPYAKKYLQIYFLGVPVIILYNFSASILRAVGDTLRPLIFLAASGAANIFLNIFFIVVLGLDVEGVAIATVASQLISAVAALVIMLRSNGYARLDRKYFRINKKILGEIFIIGLPMGLSKCSFSLANIIIYSSLNVLGDAVMAANSIAKEFDAFILETLHGISVACLAVVSQNLGAKRPDRIKRTVYISVILVTIIGVVLGALIYLVGADLCDIMTDTEEVIEYCMVRILIVSVPYTICGLINVVQETIRGLGYSNTALAISIGANIGYRLIWIWGIYPALAVKGDISRNYGLICLVWPTSWIVGAIFAVPCMCYLYRKVKKKLGKSE